MGWAPLPADVQLDDTQTGNVNNNSVAALAPPSPASPTPTGFVPLPPDAKLDAPANEKAQPPTERNGPAQVVPGNSYQAGFADELPAQPANEMPPELQKQLVQILSTHPVETAASDARQFAAAHGYGGPGDNFDQIVAYRKAHGQVSDEVVTKMPPPSGQPMTAGAAAVRGAGNLFGANTIDAAIHTAKDVVTGDTSNPIQDFQRWEDINYGVQQADEENHPTARLVGQLIGGLAIPSGFEGEALAAGKSVLRAGGTIQEARAAALAAARNRLAVEGAGAGAVTGFDTSAPGQGVLGAVEGAATGGAAGYGLAAAGQAARPVLGKAADAIAANRPAIATPEAIDAARAANDLNITLPKFALSDADRASAGALEQTAAGRAPIRAGRSEMLDTSQVARNQIASDVGTAAETPQQLGDETLDAAIKANKARRENIGTLYDYAQSASLGVPVQPSKTVSTLNSLLSDESQKIGGSKIAPVLQNIRDDLGQAGSITVDQARNLRTTLREQLTNEAGSTPSNADRITNQVMAAVNADMRDSLPSDAFNIYRQADQAWAQQRTLEDEVLKPFLGRDFDNWGEQVAAKINSDAKGNGTRLARFLASLPDDQANNVRASLIQRLGSSREGSQNAAGDNFSLATFLTNWNQIKGARNLIFSPETRQALDKLAKVADLGKLSEAERNNSRTGGVISRLLMGAGEFGGGAAILTGHIREGVIGLLASGLMAARQYGAAKLLANPDFAKKLAATPLNPKAAQAFWNRPWVQAMAVKNPAIAPEVQMFQRAVNDNLRYVVNTAASPDANKNAQVKR